MLVRGQVRDGASDLVADGQPIWGSSSRQLVRLREGLPSASAPQLVAANVHHDLGEPGCGVIRVPHSLAGVPGRYSRFLDGVLGGNGVAQYPSRQPMRFRRLGHKQFGDVVVVQRDQRSFGQQPSTSDVHRCRSNNEADRRIVLSSVVTGKPQASYLDVRGPDVPGSGSSRLVSHSG